jgi:AcrR family transcriptional regulator
MLHVPEVETPARSDAPRESRARAEKRDRILDAAIAVFARTGYHGARISDIAQEAGIAYGLVYHYFRNKQDVLESIFAERWNGFLEAVEGIAGGSGPSADKLASIAALILGAYRVRPDWVKVFVLEIQRNARVAEPARLRAVGRLFETVAAIVRQGQRAGELRADLDPEVACLVFVGALEISITALVLGVIRLDANPEGADGFYSTVARDVVGIFLRGVAADTSS